jgi:hypothetical protein
MNGFEGKFRSNLPLTTSDEFRTPFDKLRVNGI